MSLGSFGNDKGDGELSIFIGFAPFRYQDPVKIKVDWLACITAIAIDGDLCTGWGGLGGELNIPWYTLGLRRRRREGNRRHKGNDGNNK